MADESSLTLDDFLALPRVAALRLSPDGRRLVATVQTISPDGKRYAGALWEIDPAGHSEAHRLTHSAKGESMQGFLPDGSILFTSSRADLESAETKQPDAPALYVLPVGGGEPRKVCAPDGGVETVFTGRASSVVVLRTPMHDGAADLDADAARAKARRDAGVQALLFEHYPMSWWDAPLSRRAPHLLALDLGAAASPPPPPRDLVPQVPWPGWQAETDADLSADGRLLLCGARLRAGHDCTVDLVRIDVATGEQRLLRRADAEHGLIAVSPDGRLVACAETEWGTIDRAGTQRLLLIDTTSGQTHELAPDWEVWPSAIAWSPDGAALFVVTDEHGHAPVYRVELDGRRTRLTASGAYTNLCPSPAGETLYALRSHFDAPPVAVALDTRAPDQTPRSLRGPATPPTLAARVEEIAATAPDGAAIHSWLVLPGEASSASPAALAMLVHGGPFSAWSGWHWRWNAQVLAAHGYAVLMPNPRLSTGYGHAHVAAAWNDWGNIPYADLMACVDAATARPDVDGARTAALGGSYGGYMANWIAGHTDRFRAIVTHASLWAMDQMHGTTDYGPFMEREFGSPYREFETWMAQSPHRSLAAITTPMLVVHGELDRRVPVAEAVRLWTDLQLHGVPSRLLLFPDENHWVLQPQNARIWYQTVLAFLDEHLRGQPWKVPDLL